MVRKVLIAGGGIGGLAAALACGRAGCGVTLMERAVAFGEAGVGIQLGPNVTRVLSAWGLSEAMEAVAAYPPCLEVRDAVAGRELGRLRLGETARMRYGAAYATLHRADLHQLLLDAVRQQTAAQILVGCAVTGFTQSAHTVTVHTSHGQSIDGDGLLGADGLWSAVRALFLRDGPPRATGHLAYRALVRQTALPAQLRSLHITAWLGPDLHVVQYPVRAGEWLNVVGIVHDGAKHLKDDAFKVDGRPAPDASGWDCQTSAAELRGALVGMCAPLQELVGAIDQWRCWTVCDRLPVPGASALSQGRVALLGDAAHPMRPYLAQGAGMAIEDAMDLGRVLAGGSPPVDAAFRAYAALRWQRDAMVQRRAMRNGRIFHARGLLRWGRDVSLRVLGERLLDMPWLYRDRPLGARTLRATGETP